MPDKFKLLVVDLALPAVANLVHAADDYLLPDNARWLFRDAAGVVAAHANEET